VQTQLKTAHADQHWHRKEFGLKKNADAKYGGRSSDEIVR
jgi:hypothetical protein